MPLMPMPPMPTKCTCLILLNTVASLLNGLFDQIYNAPLGIQNGDSAGVTLHLAYMAGVGKEGAESFGKLFARQLGVPNQHCRFFFDHRLSVLRLMIVSRGGQ